MDEYVDKYGRKKGDRENEVITKKAVSSSIVWYLNWMVGGTVFMRIRQTEDTSRLKKHVIIIKCINN